MKKILILTALLGFISAPALGQNALGTIGPGAVPCAYTDCKVKTLTVNGATLPSNGGLAIKSTASNSSDLSVVNTAGNGALSLSHDGGGAAAISMADNGNNTNVSITSNTTITSFIKGPFNTSSGIATPAGGSATAVLLLGTTTGFGIYYGSGVPTVSAGQGSLYLRSDGSSTSTRMYINTTGSTVWTAVTTAG